MHDPDRRARHHVTALTLTLQHFLTMEKGFSYITLHQPAQAVKIELKYRVILPAQMTSRSLR